MRDWTASSRRPSNKRTGPRCRAAGAGAVEAIPAWLLEHDLLRDATLVSVLAYAGLRPGEALALHGGLAQLLCDIAQRPDAAEDLGAPWSVTLAHRANEIRRGHLAMRSQLVPGEGVSTRTVARTTSCYETSADFFLAFGPHVTMSMKSTPLMSRCTASKISGSSKLPLSFVTRDPSCQHGGCS